MCCITPASSHFLFAPCFTATSSATVREKIERNAGQMVSFFQALLFGENFDRSGVRVGTNDDGVFSRFGQGMVRLRASLYSFLLLSASVRLPLGHDTHSWLWLRGRPQAPLNSIFCVSPESFHHSPIYCCFGRPPVFPSLCNIGSAAR